MKYRQIIWTLLFETKMQGQFPLQIRRLAGKSAQTYNEISSLLFILPLKTGGSLVEFVFRYLLEHHQ